VPDHVYDNGNDTECNVCGFHREACNHQWDNACDTLCNVEGCGYVRQVPDHVYANACDTACDVCGHTRTVGDHVSDKAACLDGNCVHCGISMPITQPHRYDHACDTDCNVCGTVRAIQHVYDNACDTLCNVEGCGYVRQVGDHRYDHACDVDCNLCGAVRATQHIYDNACDAVCNVEGCGNTRQVPDHVYDHGCDADCNVCGAVRATRHEYDNDCDTDCNVEGCGAIRTVGDHVWVNGACNICGITSPSRVTITSESATASYAKMGAKASAKVTAEGDGLTYTWYIKNEGSSKYSKSSVTKATYSTTMSDKAKNRRVYCVVEDAYGNQAKSKTFLLRESVSLTKQPSSAAAYAKKGAKVSVKLTASGDGLKYTWYIKNEGKTSYSKSSVTSATYSATMSSKVKGRRVYCVVKDKYGKTVQSKTFILRESVSIVTQPKTVTVAKNKTAKVTVKASGDGLKYTWYVKNEGAKKYSKSSIKKSSYSVTMTSKVKNRLVYCVVTDKYGKTVKSTTVRLKMK